jgi:phosphoglycerate kinase
MPQKIHFIDEAKISENHVLLRLDLNVSLNPDFSIADDARLRQSLPTIEYLLKNKNKLIILSHLGRPKKRDSHYSLSVVVDDLQRHLPKYKITFVENYFSPDTEKKVADQAENEILLFENTRFYPEEQNNDKDFAKKLSKYADVYVNDAFAVSHREEATIVGIPRYLPSYGGLLLKKEITMISKAIKNPRKPVVSIVGGAKIATKIKLLDVFIKISDYVLIGGALANDFLVAKGYDIGDSVYDKDYVETAKRLISHAKRHNTQLMIPTDGCVKFTESNRVRDKKVEDIPADGSIIDIGQQTQADYGWVIDKAKTIIWNGPMGYIEDPRGRQGTDNIYYAVTSNKHATSIVGGGDTIAAISKREYLDKITHLSTGGGAMLQFIQDGTLPGIKALEHSHA